MDTLDQIKAEINKGIESLDKSIQAHVLLAQQETARLFKQRYPKRRLEFYSGMGVYGCTVHTTKKQYEVDEVRYEHDKRFNAKHFPMLVDFLEFIAGLNIPPQYCWYYVTNIIY